MNATLSKLEDATYVIEGTLGFNTVSDIAAQADKLIDFNQNAIIDCYKLDHCDSAGMALFIQWYRKAISNGVNFLLKNITTQMRHLIQLMNLNHFFLVK